MVNAQEWLNKEYPLNRRSEVTELDISKGKVKRWDGHERILKGDLKLEGFTNLRKLIIFSHQITSLDVSDCLNLEELDCHANKLTKLNVTGCFNLRRIDCSNSPLRELDLSACANLEVVNLNNCSNLNTDTIKSNLNYETEIGKLLKNDSQVRKAKENDIRNILIVGITGNGKSALANTLSDNNNFRESRSSTSVTKSFQTSDIFEWQDKKYRVIDNIGFGDTNNISEEDILFKIGEGIHAAKEGINQILFVFGGRFSPEQVEVFKKFESFISKSSITKFTTIVRTRFDGFRDPKKCEKDRQSLLSEDNKDLRKIINCNGFIHVDNPPIPELDEDEADSDDEREIEQIKESKRASRKKVLNHLAENCQEIYKPKEWDSIYTMVENYNKRKEQIKKADSSHRNILIIGKTGSGKSSLSNVLLNKDSNFEEIFAEGDGSTSKTRKRQPEEFKTNGKKYRIVDTVGFGDTKLSEDYLLNKSKELFDLLKGGINQILLVNDSKMFTKEEAFAFNFLKKYVFGENIGKYTTIIRTNFSDFQRIEKIHEDLKKTIREDDNANDLIRSCRDIIYVDNPTIKVTATDDESNKKEQVIINKNKRTREKSRKILLDYLEKCEDIYELEVPKVRAEITELDISNEYLKGGIKLEGFVNLKILNCSQNKLSKLDISDCPKLETLNCSFNELESVVLTDLGQLKEFACNNNNLNKLDLSFLNPVELTSLNISDNNFSKQLESYTKDDIRSSDLDLTIFSKFFNLENLLVGNEDKQKISQGIYNRFFGSLKPLKNMNKLELLYISNTDIDSGLEHLPKSVEVIYCSTKESPGSKVKKLAEELSEFIVDKNRGGYDFQNWREKQQEKQEAQIEMPTKK